MLMITLNALTPNPIALTNTFLQPAIYINNFSNLTAYFKDIPLNLHTNVIHTLN